MDWHQEFIKDGYVTFPKLVPQNLIGAACAAIQADLHDHYDPARRQEYDSISYCTDLCHSQPIMALLREISGLETCG